MEKIVLAPTVLITIVAISFMLGIVATLFFENYMVSWINRRKHD